MDYPTVQSALIRLRAWGTVAISLAGLTLFGYASWLYTRPNPHVPREIPGGDVAHSLIGTQPLAVAIAGGAGLAIALLALR